MMTLCSLIVTVVLFRYRILSPQIYDFLRILIPQVTNFQFTANVSGCHTEVTIIQQQQEGWLPPTKRASAAKIN